MEVVTSGFGKCSRRHLNPCQRSAEWDSVFGGMLAYMAFKFSDSKLSLLGFHYIINYFYQALRCLHWARHMLRILFLGCVGTAVLVLFSCVWAIGFSGMMVFFYFITLMFVILCTQILFTVSCQLPLRLILQTIRMYFSAILVPCQESRERDESGGRHMLGLVCVPTGKPIQPCLSPKS